MPQLIPVSLLHVIIYSFHLALPASGFQQPLEEDPSIHKCCPHGSIIIQTNGSFDCQELDFENKDNAWVESIYLDPNTISNRSTTLQFTTFSIPKCTPWLIMQEYRILENGQVAICGSRPHPPESTFPVWLSLNNTLFCIDEFEENKSRNSIALVCHEALVEETDKIQALLKKFIHDTIESCSKTIGWVSMVSAIFIVMAITVYFMLWREQNTHGWTQLSFLVALFLTYFVAGLRRLIGYERLQSSDLALTFELLEDFGAVSTSANLVALSFDLFFTLWRSVPTYSKRDGFRRFLVTSAIAWSSGLAVTTVGIIVKSGQRTELVLSKLGSISAHLRQLVEFFLCIPNDMLFSFCLPVVQLTLFLLNLVLFLTSVVVLYQKHQVNKLAFENIGKSIVLRFWIRRILKLFLLMRLWWPISIICVFDCIAMTKYTIKVWKAVLATFYSKPNHVEYEIPWHVYLTSNLLAIQAIIISLIFVWNRKTFVALKKQYPNIYTIIVGH